MVTAQLQIKSAYSLLESTISLDKLVAKASEYGYKHLAITDHNVLYAVPEFYQACAAAKIHPIIGMQIDYQDTRYSQHVFQLILLAKNQQGYQNLMQISTIIMEERQGKAIAKEQLSAYLSNLVVIFPFENSECNHFIDNEKENIAVQVLTEWQKVTDSDCLYGGIAVLGHQLIEETLRSFYQRHGVPYVALQDIRYLNPSDDFSLRVLHNIDLGTKLADDFFQQTGPYYLPSIAEMESKFAHLAPALQAVDKIANLCQFELPLHQKLLPHYQVPDGYTAESYLQELCATALPQRVHQLSPAYHQRLQMELQVIHSMGFDDYFLIVWDVMNYCQQEKIVTGAGRGSSAGSLVAFVLHITDVDPIQYNLLFERFLNSERHSMPDIDIDIPDNRRDQVLQYVHQKYGEHHVAQIATFGTMAAKMAIRDVARVFGLSQSEANQWSNAIPNTLKITLEEAKNQSKALRDLIATSERNRLLFATSQSIEGLPRHVSTHAAGVVISDQDLTKLIPLQMGSNQLSLTQYTMGAIEEIGLLKMDFLGLRNLSIIDDTLRNIRFLYREELNLQTIPIDDEATMQLFKQGQTIGVFQFESDGIRRVLQKIEPNSMEDIAAVNALYRPGPMDNIDLFTARKKGWVPIEYPDDCLKDVLANTYGIIVYQEQIMQVAARMAGFTLGQGDILSRAISKKKKTVLAEQRQAFIDGAVNNGHSSEAAITVYNYIDRFANYGFNRSHAMAYSMVAYRMAYLKVHYPIPFFAALLHSVRNNPNKTKEYIQEVKRCRIELKAPTINSSQLSFSVSQTGIMFGLTSVKGLRRDFAKEILAERAQHGSYRSFDNFLIRIDSKWLKEDSLVPLIQVGLFDEIEENRRQLVVDLEGKLKNILYTGGSLDLLDILSLKKETIHDYSQTEKLDFEEEYLGTYLSGHPVDKYQSLRVVFNGRTIQQLMLQKNQIVLVYSKSIRIIKTKKGEQMAFLSANDGTGEISVTLFPKLYRKYRSILQTNQVYLVRGRVERSTYNQELQILADQLELATDYQSEIGSEICYLKVPESLEFKQVMPEIKTVLGQFHGINAVIVHDAASQQTLALPKEYWICKSQASQTALANLIGNENIVFK